MEPAGSRPLGALPPNLSLPFLGSLPSPSLPPLFFHSPSFCPPTPRFVPTSHNFPTFLLPLLPGSYAVIYIFVLSLSSCGDNLEFLWDVSFKIFK